MTETLQLKETQMYSNVSTLVCKVIGIAVILLFGYLLAKNNKKTLIFFGAAFFGIEAASVIKSFISSYTPVNTQYDITGFTYNSNVSQ